MNDKKRLWLVGASALVAGVLLGASVAWYVQQQHVDDLRQDVARSASDSSRLDATTALLEEKERLLEQLTEKYDELRSKTASPTALHGTGDATTAPAAKDARQFAYIDSISTGSTPTLVADYAQFLTGDAAEKAAKKAGSESPPPNDYYIVNESKKLRTIPVSPSVKVTLTTKPGVGPVDGGYTSDLATLAGYLASDTEETAGLKADGFWLTIKDGTVTAIAEQYVP